MAVPWGQGSQPWCRALVQMVGLRAGLEGQEAFAEGLLSSTSLQGPRWSLLGASLIGKSTKSAYPTLPFGPYSQRGCLSTSRLPGYTLFYKQRKSCSIASIKIKQQNQSGYCFVHPKTLAQSPATCARGGGHWGQRVPRVDLTSHQHTPQGRAWEVVGGTGACLNHLVAHQAHPGTGCCLGEACSKREEDFSMCFELGKCSSALFWMRASTNGHTSMSSWCLKTLCCSLYCPRQELGFCSGSSTLRKYWDEHLTHFLFPAGIKKWQRVIASWNKWQFYNLPQWLGDEEQYNTAQHFYSWEKKKRNYFKLIGRVPCTASRYISVNWLIPLCTKTALTNNASWELTAIYLTSSKSLAHPLVLLRTSNKAQGLYIMLSSLILDIKQWCWCWGNNCSLFEE